MDKKYTCYCGLFCQNCAVKVQVEPAAKVLYEEMKKAGFEDIIQMIPGGADFWTFLKGMVKGVCVSCKDGSGNPGCAVRKCAKDKNIEMCALCDSYPCELFVKYFEGYPMLREDNNLLREEGMDAWAKLQDDRHLKGYAFSDEIAGKNAE